MALKAWEHAPTVFSGVTVFILHASINEIRNQQYVRLPDDEQLDKALYAWVIQQRSTATPISRPFLQEKAKHFSMQLNTETADREFKASTGWLEKLQPQHGIRNLSIQGEKLSAAGETVQPFPKKVFNVMDENKLIPEEIYNADDTGLWWKCLLQKNSRFQSRKIQDSKKERIV